MKSEHLFIIRLGDGRHFEYEGTLDGAKRKASKLATPPVAIQLLAEQRLVATRRPYFGWDGKVGWHPLGASREGFLSRAALRSNVRQYPIDM